MGRRVTRYIKALRERAHRVVRGAARTAVSGSLKTQLIVGSAALALCILAVTYMTLSGTTREAASRQAKAEADRILRFFSDSVAEALAAGDRMQLHLSAEALLRNGVHAITVTDREGNPIYVSRSGFEAGGLMPGKDTQSPDGSQVAVSFKEGYGFLHAAMPVRFGDRQVGAVHLWIDKDRLELSLRRAHAYVYPIFMTGFMLVCLLCLMLLYTPFRALDRLTVVADRIGSGDLTARVPTRGHDEIARFCRAFNEMVGNLQRARGDINRMHIETIHAMIDTVEAKDPYTEGHCLRVSSLSRDILRSMDVPRDERFQIETAALLHDIGKIGIPDQVLFKESSLTPAEVRIIQSHVTIGESILLRLDSMRDVACWVRHHHERWDGTGYPDALRAEEIPFASRVITVADTVDAMMTNRPYRQGLPFDTVVRILEKEKGKQFDPEIVEHAISVLSEHEDNPPPALDLSVRAFPVAADTLGLESRLQLA